MREGAECRSHLIRSHPWWDRDRYFESHKRLGYRNEGHKVCLTISSLHYISIHSGATLCFIVYSSLHAIPRASSRTYIPPLILINNHRFRRTLFNKTMLLLDLLLFAILLPLKFLLAPPHASFKHLASLNENPACAPFASELDDRTDFGDFDAPS